MMMLKAVGMARGLDSHAKYAAAACLQGEVATTRKCQKYSELSTAYLFLPIAV